MLFRSVQTLVGINVELATLSKSSVITEKAAQDKIAHTQKLVEESVTAVHRFARDLRPAILDDLGLIPALQAYSESLAARKKIKIEILASEAVENLDITRRTVLFRVAQEALTNIGRHANATKVKMNLVEFGESIRMEISDNGQAFQVGKTLNGNKNCLGMIGMRERVEMVGGVLTIESVIGKGTTVRAEIPMPKQEKKGKNEKNNHTHS